MSKLAASAITNAVGCIEYAVRHVGNATKRDQAFDNARQALDYAEDHAPTKEQRAVIGRMRLRLPEWERTTCPP